jgi:hypothetical protein
MRLEGWLQRTYSPLSFETLASQAPQDDVWYEPIGFMESID